MMTSAIIAAATTVSFWMCGLPADATPCAASILIETASHTLLQEVPLELVSWEWDGHRHKGVYWNPYGPQWAPGRVRYNGELLPFGDCGASLTPTPTPAPVHLRTWIVPVERLIGTSTTRDADGRLHSLSIDWTKIGDPVGDIRRWIFREGE